MFQTQHLKEEKNMFNLFIADFSSVGALVPSTVYWIKGGLLNLVNQVKFEFWGPGILRDHSISLAYPVEHLSLISPPHPGGFSVYLLARTGQVLDDK